MTVPSVSKYLNDSFSTLKLVDDVYALTLTYFCSSSFGGGGARSRDRMEPVQSVYITTKAVNPVHGEAYSIQHYVTKFVSNLRHAGGFLWVKTGRYDMTEKLLKVALITINQHIIILVGNMLLSFGSNCSVAKLMTNIY